MGRRWWAGIIVAVVAGLVGLAGPAEGAPSVACQRYSQLLDAPAFVTKEVLQLAKYHCQHNPGAATRVSLRPKNEWAYPPGRVCDAVSFGVYAPPGLGLGSEKNEARCVTSWYEYSLYADAHPKCMKKINAAFRQQQIDNGSEEERPDLSRICPDPGNDNSKPLAKAAEKSDFILGAFGIGGWICVGVVALVIGGAIAGGGKYIRS